MPETMHDYKLLQYYLRLALDAKDNQEIHHLTKQIKRFETKWSLPCSFTSLQESHRL